MLAPCRDGQRLAAGTLFLTTLIALLSACTATHPADDTTRVSGGVYSSGDATRIEGEQLLATPPQGWIMVARHNTGRTRLADFVPAGQEEFEWESKLSFESFRDMSGADPIELLLDEAESDDGKCGFVQHFNLFSGFENAYPTSLRLFMCTVNENTRMGEIKLMKAIQGDDYFYIVKVVKRVPAFRPHQADMSDAEIAAWSTWMRGVRVCNRSSDDHPCPIAGSPAEGPADTPPGM